MGKPTGFMDYERIIPDDDLPEERIHHFNEFHHHLSSSKQSYQAARCMDCGVPFCQNGHQIGSLVSGCPLTNLIPETNDLIYRNNYKAALKRLLKTNSFPEFTSRVCPALCEKACTCSLDDDAVTVKENEYSIIETGYKQGWMQPQRIENRINKSIAVIGSGPAGLSVADRLNKRGYNVDVYEKSDRLGGLLMYGIPNMKLDKRIIERRMHLMEEEGIRFYTNTPVTSKEHVERLKHDYDKIVLACGCSTPRDIKVEGRDAEGIYFAVDYLTGVTQSLLDSQLKDHHYIDTKDKNVLVIGGGDTGNDCVATAIRLGCKSVVQVEMMGEMPEKRLENNPWPEYPRVKKTDYGQQECIALFHHDPRVYNTSVHSFIKNEHGKLTGVNLVSVKFENGKLVELKDTIKKIECDLVLIAAGFISADQDLAKLFNIHMTSNGHIEDTSYRTNQKNIYVCGDMRRGASLVVWAIREGREAAKVIDQDMMGYSPL